MIRAGAVWIAALVLSGPIAAQFQVPPEQSPAETVPGGTDDVFATGTWLDGMAEIAHAVTAQSK